MANFQCVSGKSVRPRCWCNAAISTSASLKLQKRSACISSLQQPCSGRAVHGPAGFRAAHLAKPQLHSPQPSDTCQRLVPSTSLLVATVASPLPSIADEVTKADDAALEAAQQYSTVTFGGSFGQWDPVIAVFFYLVVGSLTILTLGVKLAPMLPPLSLKRVSKFEHDLRRCSTSR